MKRTSLMLPDDLKIRAHNRAKGMGISLGELIRESLEITLDNADEEKLTKDSLFADDALYDGEVPKDLSRNHDQYLYGEK